MKYWDSSALVPLILNEPATLSVERIFRQDPFIVTSWTTSIECFSAVMRRKREGHLTEEGVQKVRERLNDFSQAMDIVVPSSELKQVTMRILSTHPLRAADSIQLASALTWCHNHTRGANFVTFDSRLKEVALAEGFNVLP